MDIKQARDLLQRYQTGNINRSEKELVERWYRQLEDTGELQWSEGEQMQMQERLESALLHEIAGPSKKDTLRSLVLRYWWAAASVVALLGAVLYVVLVNEPERQREIVNRTSPNDIPAPQSNRAMITLANGKTVYLDSMNNGFALLQGNAKLVKLSNGEIAYESSGLSAGKIQYNTLVNPRGSRVINMLLTDGTKVWLNAGSSLKYPVVFTGDRREVSVTGEAYFEVAHDKAKQFIVHKDAVDVVVLGTHFNVNAFEDDDDNIKVTLLEGAVKIKNGNSDGSLKPGQQALIHDDVKIVNDVNVENVMAWKNGYFQFDKASLQSVLKQVARWYDVDVVYEGNNRSRQFVGEIERDLSLSEMLKILEINKVSFTIEGKKLLVKPD